MTVDAVEVGFEGAVCATGGLLTLVLSGWFGITASALVAVGVLPCGASVTSFEVLINAAETCGAAEAGVAGAKGAFFRALHKACLLHYC